ncbi:MAG TPA: sigma-70 family RNA polymerase sigma factor [Acidimicrobiales bacterium]|nr:sigma-70 family RNA polymerase sigma factor [Acidimicrobiales bacterium]
MNPRPAGYRRWSSRLRRDGARPGSAGPPAVGLAGDGELAREADPEGGDGPAPLDGERHLLAAAAAGDPEAVRWLLDEVAPIVFGFLFARVGGDEAAAEDLLQETLLEAVRGAAAFRAEASASTWMCAIARRRLARYYESERKAEVARRSLSLVPGGPGSTGPSEDILEQQDEVVRALGRLPAMQRQVLVLKYLEDMSVVDIAEQVNRSRVQVQSLLQRGREGLRRELAGAVGGSTGD